MFDGAHDPASSSFALNFGPSHVRMADGTDALAIRVCRNASGCSTPTNPDMITFTKRVTKAPLALRNLSVAAFQKQWQPNTEARIIKRPNGTAEQCGVQDPRIVFDRTSKHYLMACESLHARPSRVPCAAKLTDKCVLGRHRLRQSLPETRPASHLRSGLHEDRSLPDARDRSVVGECRRGRPAAEWVHVGLRRRVDRAAADAVATALRLCGQGGWHCQLAASESDSAADLREAGGVAGGPEGRLRQPVCGGGRLAGTRGGSSR